MAGENQILVIPQGAGGGGGGSVNSVLGTVNRITSTGGVDPVIDIASNYIGQSSITTLGTIGSGTWQGTPIANAFLAGIAWSKVTGTPTTISGYGIIDAYTKTEIDRFVSGFTPDHILVGSGSGRISDSGYSFADLWLLGTYIPANNFKVYNNTGGVAAQINNDSFVSSLTPLAATTATAYSWTATPTAQNNGDTLNGFVWNSQPNTNSKTGLTTSAYSWKVLGTEAMNISLLGVITFKGVNSTSNVIAFAPDSNSGVQTFQIKSNAGQSAGISFQNGAGTALANLRHFNISDNVTNSYLSWQVGAGIYLQRSGTAGVASALIHLAPVTATTSTPMHFDVAAVEKTSPVDGDIWYSSSGTMAGWKFRLGSQTMIWGRQTGWTLPTGTAAKGFAATYAGQTMGAVYSQSQAQTLDDTVKTLSQTVKAIIDHLYTNMNTIGA